VSTTTSPLPVSQTHQPTEPLEVARWVAEAYATQTPVYPVGGGTSLDFGLPAKAEGWALSLAGLQKVVDYPARDMTITVEAGVTMRQLADLLAEEGQQLPIDVPDPERATIGGVVATNFNGPRRFGMGAIRDYVIGIHAVDGRGRPFKGGGRVVKNVAGYDFCKLLTGSLGTLGVITHMTLRLRPLAEKSAFLIAEVADLTGPDWAGAERQLAALADLPGMPTAVELLVGPAWANDPALPAKSETARPDAVGSMYLAVGFEGTASEVDWLCERLATQWRGSGLPEPRRVTDDAAHECLQRLAQFPAEPSPLVLKGGVVPSHVTRLMAAARELSPDVSLLAHAGNGTVLARFAQFPAAGLARTVVARLQSLAAIGHGSVSVLSNPGGSEMTHQCVWGGIDAPFDLMTSVKRQFDPRNVLNPGRFVYL
jgi:glycolate oxidase FAD binding subunit